LCEEMEYAYPAVEEAHGAKVGSIKI
jgi:hypothetical protein